MGENQQKFEAMRGQVEVWRQELGIPGTAFGLLIGDEQFTAGLGVTSVKNPLSVNDETIFQIGSITKTVTATLMMCLVEEGKLDLDEPVRTYLPDFQVRDDGVSKTVTVRHLLTHSAGWVGDVFEDTGTNDDAVKKYVADMVELEQLAPLDTAISYNNAAFCVAGLIIEVVTGKTFEQAVQDMIFAPLDMKQSYFFPRDVMLERFVVGHRVSDTDETDDTQVTKTLSPWSIPRASNAAGGISCTIKDLLTYGRFHIGDGEPILSTESLNHMHSPRTYINDYLGSICLAWFMRDVGGVKTLSHTGGTVGQISILVLVPEHNAVFAMVTNAENGGALTAKFYAYVLKEYFGVTVPEAKPIDSTVEELAGYAGTYRRPLMDITLKMEDDDLYAHITLNGGLPNDDPISSPPPARMARCGEDQLIILEGRFKNTRADILRDETGDIRYLRLGSRINPRVVGE